MNGQALSWGPVSRPVSDAVLDDLVLPFAVEPLDVRGRVVRLGAAIGRILARHDYPAPVARLAGAAVLTVLGRFHLRTRAPYEGPFIPSLSEF